MTQKPDLVLDLDETLIKSYFFCEKTVSLFFELSDDNKLKYLIDNPDICHIVQNEFDDLFLMEFTLNNKIFIVYKRPYLIDFLLEMNKYFNITIYSLGEETYVNIILNKITKIIGFTIFKEICANTIDDYRYFKLLYNVDVDIDNCIIIDDRDNVWIYDTKKLYNIKPYEGPEMDKDIELKKIMDKTNKYMESFTIIDCEVLLYQLKN